MKKLLYAFGVYCFCVKTHELINDGFFTEIGKRLKEDFKDISKEPDKQKETKKEEPGSIKKIKNKIGF